MSAGDIFTSPLAAATLPLGDSRKYPYHIMGSISRGRGWVSWTGILKALGGSNAVWNSKRIGAGGSVLNYDESCA